MLYVSNDKATSKSNLSLVNPDHLLSALNACPLSQNFLSGKIALYKCQKTKLHWLNFNEVPHWRSVVIFKVQTFCVSDIQQQFFQR